MSRKPPRSSAAPASRETLLARLQPYGQEHLLAFWDSLSPGERLALAEQIQSVDFERGFVPALDDRLR